MFGDTDETMLMKRYLLGEVQGDQRAQFEERYFSDDEFFERLCAIEDELIDEYLRGTLAPGIRDRFEEAFFRSEKRSARVAFARRLQQAVETIPLADSSAAKSRLDRSPGIPSSQTFFFTLAPGLVRSEGVANKLVAPRGTHEVVLQLPVEQADHASYGAVLRTAEGEEVLSAETLSMSRTESGLQAAIRVPASLIKPGDYIVTLTGLTEDGTMEELDSYFFRAVGQQQ